MRATNILLTGPPGCGKSTVIERIVAMLHGPTTGFFTRELRERGNRTGFEIVTLDGRRAVLAHVAVKSVTRVGKYGVSLDNLDRVAVPSMIPSSADQIVVIDEIGKMECFSRLFRGTLIRVLDSPNVVLGSIALKGGEFIEGIKRRADVTLVRVSEQNRDGLIERTAKEILEGQL